MLKILSLLTYISLSGLCFFNTNSVQACAGEYEIPYDTIDKIRRDTKTKLGHIIVENPSCRKAILKNCLLSAKRIEGRVVTTFTSQEIIQFFKAQGLIKHVGAIEISNEGHAVTFDHTYGLEFSGHGPVEGKVIGLIRELIVQGDITFLDIGAGYGSFAKRVLEACESDLDKITLFVNEHLSVQCYHAAKLLESWKQVFLYPRDILFDLMYHVDQKFNISTIFNVHHFMSFFEFEDSIQKAYDFTLPNGYHVAISLSPYHLGDESTLAKFHEARVQQNKEHPGFFRASDFSLLGFFNIRDSYFPSKEVYEKFFKRVGFSVEEVGYFSLSGNYSKEFTYIIGKKN